MAFIDFKTPSKVIYRRLTEVIQPDDLCAKDPRMSKALQDELKDLPRRGIFKVILKWEIPEGLNALIARYVLAIRLSIDGEVKFNARYFIVDIGIC